MSYLKVRIKCEQSSFLLSRNTKWSRRLSLERLWGPVRNCKGGHLASSDLVSCKKLYVDEGSESFFCKPTAIKFPAREIVINIENNW